MRVDVLSGFRSPPRIDIRRGAAALEGAPAAGPGGEIEAGEERDAGDDDGDLTPRGRRSEAAAAAAAAAAAGNGEGDGGKAGEGGSAADAADEGMDTA